MIDVPRARFSQLTAAAPRRVGGEVSRSPRPQTWARSERGGVGAVQILATLLSHPLLPAHTLFVQSKVVGLGFGNFQGKRASVS